MQKYGERNHLVLKHGDKETMKHASDEIAVALKKQKLILLLLGAIAFVALGYWLWLIAEDQIRFYPLFVKVIAINSIVFFGMCSIYIFAKLFDTKPGLIVDQDGIVDNSSGVSAGRIQWSEITGFMIKEVSGQSFIAIGVSDPEKYLQRGGFLKRSLNAASFKMTGSPINISSNSLDMNFGQLHQTLISAFEKYRKT